MGMELYQKDRALGARYHLVQTDQMGRGASGAGLNVKGLSVVVPFNLF